LQNLLSEQFNKVFLLFQPSSKVEVLQLVAANPALLGLEGVTGGGLSKDA
jgi:hypothetical protein